MNPRQSPNAHDPSLVVAIDIETIVPNPPPGDGFPKWPLHRPVVASMLTARSLGRGRYDFQLDNVLYDVTDPARFYREVDRHLPQRGTAVSANGRGFDFPNLAIGAMAQRCFKAVNLSAQFRANRFGGLHADLCELFSNFAGAPRPSLTEICGALGIPVKVDSHGSEVADYHAAGDVDRIVAYCAQDTVATYVAWLFWAAFCDGDDALIAEPLALLARWIEAAPERSHLLAIADCAPARWARARALELQIERAARRADRRIELAKAERAFGGLNIADYIEALPTSPAI